MSHEAFIKENEKQIEMFKRIASLPHNKRIKDEEFKTQFHKESKTFKGVKAGTIDLVKLIEYKEEWLKLYQKTNGNHEEKKFAADKKLGVKLAQLYIPNFAQRATYDNMSKANRKLKRQLPYINQPVEMKVGAKGETPVVLSESDAVEVKPKVDFKES